MAETADTELVALARQGDKEAFGLLEERYHTLALRLAMRLLAKENNAQDEVQEAMLQAYLSLDNLRDSARFKGWLCGIVLNVCRSHLRNRKVAFFSLEAMAGGLQFEAVTFWGPAVTPEKTAEERELHQIVLDAIDLEFEDVRARLAKLYDVLETGKLSLDDLAPRIKELKAR